MDKTNSSWCRKFCPPKFFPLRYHVFTIVHEKYPKSYILNFFPKFSRKDKIQQDIRGQAYLFFGCQKSHDPVVKPAGKSHDPVKNGTENSWPGVKNRTEKSWPRICLARPCTLVNIGRFFNEPVVKLYQVHRSGFEENSPAKKVCKGRDSARFRDCWVFSWDGQYFSGK